MLFLKRTGFLFLMAMLGVLSILLHMNGYPFAWKVHTNHSYWLPLSYSINVFSIVVVVATVFWGLRGFLFGRGRPWLALFCIGTWVVIWAVTIGIDVKDKEPTWTTGLFFGSNALNDKARALEQQPWSVKEVVNFPDVHRKQICTSAILGEDELHIIVKREGIPINLNFPKEMAEKGLFNTNACPSDLIQQYKKIKNLDEKIKAIVSEPDYGLADLKHLNAISLLAAKAGLWAHPDTIVKMSEIYKTHKTDPIKRKVEVAEMELRLYTNGQVREHEWEEMKGQTSDEVRKIYIDLRIWNESYENGADTWNFWSKWDLVSGASKLVMATIDCKNKKLQLTNSIASNTEGQLKISHISDDMARIKKESWAEEWLQKVCSSKDKQARIPEEIANEKFGS